LKKDSNIFSLEWSIKWIASIILLGAISFRGLDGFQNIDLILSLIGTSGWFIVSIMWKDLALILLNSFAIIFLARNLFENTII
tara:strand:- start:576 stop:824 length:249 start_codon:yes stop_codon:yes gene_type:complete